jgi:hypothetical protein
LAAAVLVVHHQHKLKVQLEQTQYFQQLHHQAAAAVATAFHLMHQIPV